MIKQHEGVEFTLQAGVPQGAALAYYSIYIYHKPPKTSERRSYIHSICGWYYTDNSGYLQRDDSSNINNTNHQYQ